MWDDILDSTFNGDASGQSFRKRTIKAGRTPALDTKGNRKVAALRRVIDDPGATQGEKDNATSLLAKLLDKEE